MSQVHQSKLKLTKTSRILHSNSLIFKWSDSAHPNSLLSLTYLVEEQGLQESDLRPSEYQATKTFRHDKIQGKNFVIMTSTVHLSSNRS